MNALWLVEAAALIASYGKAITYTRLGLSLPALNSYWISSRQRADDWHESIGWFHNQLSEATTSQRVQLWNELNRVIREVFLTEILSRVLAAIALELERECIDEDAAPITGSVAKTHAEARQRCLKLLLDGPGQPSSGMMQLNRLRFYAEEWTDRLLSLLGDCHGSRTFAHRIERMKEWAEESNHFQTSETSNIQFQLAVHGTRKWVSATANFEDANPDLNRTIGESILAMLRPEWFHTCGTMRSLTSHRMQSIISETSSVIDFLDAKQGDSKEFKHSIQNLERYRNAGLGDAFSG